MEYSRHVLLAIVLLTLVLHGDSAPSSRRSREAQLTDEDSTRQSKITTDFKTDPSTTTPAPTGKSARKNKALNFLGYFPSFLSSGLDYAEDDDDDVTFAVNDDNFDDDDLSRTIPSRRKNQNKKKNGNGNNNYANDNINSLQYDNSPIFYIRLPPTPYMFVPGLGYVSQPPSLGPPMGMSPAVPPQVDPFINVPVDFVSNGKPTGVYQWSGAPAYNPVDPYGYQSPQPIIPAPRPTYNQPSYSNPRPKPQSNSKVTNLKGPYVFNGKPNDSVYVLRDTYNSIYSDALQNFYP